ncbi:MAG: hypothetical protein M3345_01225 [Actinomycetota bacterium]|nr:hypothetical protein [Actinomycetota bacterium]
MTRLLRYAAVALVAVSLLSRAAPAAAWSNGVGGADSYGTHDWVLDKALQGAGATASWVRAGVALRTTDDPDTVDGLDHASGSWWHVWDEWGATYGGAPEAAQVWFDRTQARLDAGRDRAASRALGILAHIVGDVAQPMHTDGWLGAEDRVHPLYEAAVDRRSGYADGVYRFVHDGPDIAVAEARTLRLARRAHRYYEPLIRQYNRHSYNERVHDITQRQLNRAANALSDLIRALR